MRIQQGKSLYIFMFLLLNIPTYIGIFMFFELGWNGFLEAGFLGPLVFLQILSLWLLLYIDKMVDLNEDHVVMTHMRLLKKRIKLKDIKFVRLGRRCVQSIPTFFLVIHTVHDKEPSDDVVGKRAMIVDLNFSKQSREKIYRYFEDKGLLESRKRFKYRNNR